MSTKVVSDAGPIRIEEYFAMSRISTALVILAFCSIAVPSRGAAQETAAPASWKIDPTHSELSFRIRHFVTKVRGTFTKWDGRIVADPARLEVGQVAVSIDANSIDTNNERRDADLRSNNFFAADSYPTLTFTSKRVQVNGEALRVIGDLTMRGRTREVVLDGSFTGSAKDMQGRERIGFEATAKVNRMDYGVAWNSIVDNAAMLGDEVEISITIEAVRQ
ncbi:MAG: YceI family protein [Gemmatimonadaceae bacterium]